ncbi:MAG: carboxypeptidase regulatory-like domain-containing protein [Acidobacteriaceae bacterium]|nr:carboxypeptidase regulatory-like domain-containing protein [Acidobacteriaceae bacterium]
MLLIPLLFLIASPEANQLCAVSGHATNALTGEPLRKVKLHLTPDADEKSNADSAPRGYVTLSGADGAFEFSGIEPGSYSLSADHLGFLKTVYGAKRRNQRGDTLILHPGQSIAELSVALTPEAILAGRVVDEDGDPVVGVRLMLMARSWNNGKSQYGERFVGYTNDRGEFRIFDVEAGKYILAAEKGQHFADVIESDGRSEKTFVETFYPGTTTPEAAAPFQIQAGQQRGDLELRLRAVQTFHVRGRVVTSALTAGTPYRTMLALEPQGKDSWFSQRYSRPGRDGTFDFSEVAPGSYRLTLRSKGKILSDQPVAVTSEDLNNVVVNEVVPVTVRGQVHVAGAAPAGVKPWNPALFQVGLRFDDGYSGKGVGSTPAKSDGSFTLENVLPGIYYLQSGVPEGAYLLSVRLNGEEMMGKPLDLSRAQAADLQIVFRYGAPELTVKVQLPAITAQPGGGETRPPAPVVVVVPEQSREKPQHFEAPVNGTGSGTFKQLSPGAYHVYAFEEVPREEINNPRFLDVMYTKGTRIELKEGERKQIELHVTSAADVTQVLSKLGINAE